MHEVPPTGDIPPTVSIEAMDPHGLLEIVPCLVVAVDDEARVAYANRTCGELLKVVPGELVGRDWVAEFVALGGRERFLELHEEALEGSEALPHVELPICDAEGSELVVEWRVVPLRDPGGQPIGSLHFGVDVSQTSQELQASRRELADIKHALDQSSIVAITDQKGIITYVNDKFCEISKYSRDELIGQDHRILNSGYHPKSYIRQLWRTIAQGAIWRGELRNRAKDGAIYWVDTTIVPFLDERDKPYQYLAIRNDITERKRAEEALREREALAQLGKMAAIIAHEVKNPLTGISGAIQVIGTRFAEDSPEQRIIGEIQARIASLAVSMRELLDFARPREVRLRSVAVRKVIDAAVAQLRQDQAMSEVQITITGADVQIDADADLLRDAFTHVLLNAGQAAGGQGRITVDVTTDEAACLVVVTDDGPGIPPEQQSQIFKPFYTTRTDGTGLGLALVRRAIDAHGGSIEVTSPPGGGTSMRISLPMR